jgi:uncharacterized repeat protein (TIGR01451 family)
MARGALKMKTILNWRTLCAPVVIGLLAMTLLSLHSTPNAQAADTGWRGPTADAADTGGDGDGFEVDSAGAYASGSDYARNMNGFNDRHRYYGFGLNVSGDPPDVMITGIEVRLDGWVDSASNDPHYSVELSWDGGTSWTTAQSTARLDTVLNSFTLGGSNDQWNHAWSIADLSDENFRVRITSVATGLGRGLRDFFLDWITVRVYYASAHIRGTIWSDDNANGVQDGPEAGLNVVHVTIYQDDGDGVFEGGGEDPSVGVSDTDINGAYDAGPFQDGYGYWIDVTEPADTILTTPPEPRLVQLPAGNSIVANFGYAPQAVTHPAIDIAKTPDTQMILTGSTVTFTIAVTNTGDVALTNVIVFDDLAPDCAATLGVLAARDSANYACAVMNVTADFTNTAIVSGTPPIGSVVTDTGIAFVNVISPAISIDKQPAVQTVISGSTVTFTIAVTNTGDVPLTNVAVSDVLTPDCVASLGVLDAGASVSYTCALAGITGDLTNTAMVSGMSPIASEVTDTASAFVDVISPAIAVDKGPAVQEVISGSTVTFTIAVTNTGDALLSGVVVSDALAPSCGASPGSLAVGASAIYQCTLTNVTSTFTNTVIAIGIPPVGALVNDTDTAQVKVRPACPSDMTAYWKLDEVSGPPYNDFCGGHAGICAGNCPAPTSGHIDGGQAFSGVNTGINVPVAAADSAFNWGVADSFTIELWTQTDAANTCTGNQVIVGRDGGTSNGLHWWVGCRTGGQATFYARNTNGILAGALGVTDLTDGRWHHVVAVRDAQARELRLSVDGLLQAVTPVTYTSGFESAAALNIGWLNLTSRYRFNGTVDEVIIYNRALEPPDPAYQLFLPLIRKP